jgi:integrase
MPLVKTQVAGKPLDAFAFTMASGAPLSAYGSNFTRRVWKPAVKAALPPALASLRFHDLRHTAVAIAIASGAARNPKALQVRMGHSTIRMTLDRYGHLLPGQDGEIADAMADPFASRLKVVSL